MDQEGQLAAQPAEPRVVSLACGSSHSLALLATPAGSMVLSWGRGEDGQLGHGDAEERRRPQAVLTLLHRGVNDLQCGAEYSVAASGTEKQLFSWGWGDFGRLGTGDCRDVFIPAPLPALSGRVVASVACGDTHTVVATDSGELFSFGRNQNGQLGLGSIQDTLSPQPVTALQGKRVVRVACGAEHSVCSTDEGEVFGWGWGRYGNVGDGETQDRHTPTKAKGLEGVKVAQVACGWRHSIAVDEAGSMYTWGWNSYGQLGHGDRIDQYIPKRVEALRQQRVALVTGGWRHTLAADGEGRVWAAGWGKFGQCGVGTNEDVVTPQQVQALAGQRVVLLESGWKHSLAVTDTGRFYAWGRNVNGQLGTGGTQDSNVPVEILALSVGSINLDAFTQEARPGGWQRAGKGRSRGWGRTGRWECGRRTSQNAWRSAHAASQLLFPCPHALPFALAMPLPPPPVGVQGVAPSDRYAVVPDSAPPSNEAGGTLQPSSAAAVPEPNKRQKV